MDVKDELDNLGMNWDDAKSIDIAQNLHKTNDEV